MSRLSESLGFVQLFEPVDKTASALVSDAVNLGKFNSFTAYISCGAITGNTVLTVYADATSAAATALTTAIAFKYRLSGGDFKAASADVFGEPTAVLATGLTMTATTFDHRTIAIEIDPDTLGATPWVAFNMDATGNPLLVSGVGIGEVRYPAHIQSTSLV
jgi:hypothetical protein